MDRSEPVPKFALKLSWNVTVPADESNNIVLLPDPTVAVKVISPLPWVMAPVTSMPPSASRLPGIITVPLLLILSLLALLVASAILKVPLVLLISKSSSLFVSVRLILGVTPSKVITLPLAVNDPSITTLLEKVEIPETSKLLENVPTPGEVDGVSSLEWVSDLSDSQSFNSSKTDEMVSKITLQ